MRFFSKWHKPAGQTLLFYFMAVWLLLNLLQAGSMYIESDEAYYWLYARQLQWGYFDHPPLVALSIKLGELLGHGPFFTRLGTVLFSTGTVYFGFKALPPRLADVRLYLLLFSSVLLFHVYGFIATPDAPLLFFTAAFFYAYRKFLAAETIAHVLLLALSIAGLFYSKYHGILPVLFTVLSNPKLLVKPRAWLVVVLVSVAFAPHLWWQYQHQWPTLRYHLSERTGGPYHVSRTGNYIAGQLFVWGVLTTIPALFFFIRKKKRRTVYERAHQFTFWGVLLFFLYSSFHNNIQVHWTLVAGPSFVVLLQDLISQASPKLRLVFMRLCSINIGLILLTRIFLLLPNTLLKDLDVFRSLTHTQPWTNDVYHFANGLPVVFVDSYRLPAIYLYHHPDAKAVGYNTVNYRKTQFNVFNDSFLNNARVCIASPNALPDSSYVLHTLNTTLFLRRMDSFKAVNALQATWQNAGDRLKKTEKQTAVVWLINTGKNTVATKNLDIAYTFLKNDHTLYTAPVRVSFTDTFLVPQSKKEIRLPLQLPEAPGPYRLVFTIVQPTLDGTFASPFYKVVVE